MIARPGPVRSTSKAISACSAKAAATTRRRIARRLVENRTAISRMTAMPTIPSSVAFMGTVPPPDAIYQTMPLCGVL